MENKNKNKISVEVEKTVTLDIKGQKIVLTEEEAESLRDELEYELSV